MNNKQTTDKLKTRGEIKEGSNETTPELPQPKKPGNNIQNIVNQLIILTYILAEQTGLSIDFIKTEIIKNLDRKAKQLKRKQSGKPC